MNTTTVAVDLAKSVFQLAMADEHWRLVETHRLTRTQFERWFANRDVAQVIMEACGSAHNWARWLAGLGIEVKLLPAQYVRAYVKRNKDRRRRCGGFTGSGPGFQHSPGARQIRGAAGLAGHASHSQPVDGHTHQPYQCPARVLPGVWHCDSRRGTYRH